MGIVKRRTGLRLRFTLLVSVLLLIMFMVIAYFLVRNAQNNDIRNINQDSKALATLATPPIGNTYDIYKDSGSFKIDQQIQSYTDLDANITNVAIIGLDGKPMYQTNPKVGLKPFNTANDFNTQYAREKNGLISQVVVPYFSSTGQHPYSLAYEINTSVLSADTAHQIKDIILFSLIGLLAAAIAMYEFIYRFFIQPIENMSRQAILISQGNYDTSMDASRKDEIGDLAQSVNTMSNKLKADIVSLREVDKLKSEFITITSHNLRTPLTIIRGNVENLHAKDLPVEITKPLHDIETSSNELASFAEDMLTISTIEAGQMFVGKESISLEALIRPLQDHFMEISNQKGVELSWDVPIPETMVEVSTSYTRGILRSLIDNAIKFTASGGTVTCEIDVGEQALRIAVQDTGIGISPDEQTKLFTKFHRGTSVLEYNYKGTGIGLYVSKLMVEAQHGAIRVSSELGKGSTFTATIPQ